jgi:hypothetical protein
VTKQLKFAPRRCGLRSEVRWAKHLTPFNSKTTFGIPSKSPIERLPGSRHYPARATRQMRCRCGSAGTARGSGRPAFKINHPSAGLALCTRVCLVAWLPPTSPVGAPLICLAALSSLVSLPRALPRSASPLTSHLPPSLSLSASPQPPAVLPAAPSPCVARGPGRPRPQLIAPGAGGLWLFPRPRPRPSQAATCISH